MVGDVADDFQRLADFLRTLAQLLDDGKKFAHRLLNGVHSGDALLHDIFALMHVV